MSNDRLLVEIRESIATVTLNRPEALNALSTEDKLSLARSVEDLGRDESVGVVVITGAGPKSFCAGSDIGVLGQTTPGDANEAVRIGLINAVVPADQLDSRVDTLARKLLAFAPAGLAANKRFMNAWLDHGLAAAVDLSIGLQGAVFAHPQTKATINDFLTRKRNKG